MMCVCACESGLVSGQGLCSIGVKRGPTQRLCLFSGSFVKSTSDHHLFLDNVFVTTELNPGGQVFINSNCYHLHNLAILNHSH